MTMHNDQNHRLGFLESAMGHPRLVVVAIIAVSPNWIKFTTGTAV